MWSRRRRAEEQKSLLCDSITELQNCVFKEIVGKLLETGKEQNYNGIDSLALVVLSFFLSPTLMFFFCIKHTILFFHTLL